MRYNLYKLGSFQFEEIVKALLKAKLGIGIRGVGTVHVFVYSLEYTIF